MPEKLVTIHEGFAHLTKQRGWYKKCKNNNKPLNINTANSFKNEAKAGGLSIEKMIELLSSAGYTIIPPKCILPDE